MDHPSHPAAEHFTQAPLGQPIPDSPHAISVSLPEWRHVIGYEEKQPEIMRQLAGGYPRFVVHPLVIQLGKSFDTERFCLPLPSLTAAELAAGFIRRVSGEPAEVLNQNGVFAVATQGPGVTAAKSFWQHTGLIMSSRQAEALLENKEPDPEADAFRDALRQELAGFYDCAEDDVFLTPTGMAAMFAALQAVLARTPRAPTAQLGFPYVDTLKLQEKFGSSAILLHRLPTLHAKLEQLLLRAPVAAAFCEIPGNPLLGSADLRDVSPLLRRARVPLVVDDVVATPVNIDLSRQADLIVTSLTKFVVGTCDAMGGATICNPRSPLYQELKNLLKTRHEELLWGQDAAVLAQRARDFPERMRRHNANGLFIAERLRNHPAIERVWYPKWEFSEAYEAVRRPDGGWGALATFLPRNAQKNSPRIYDRLGCLKGPSLGTVFTLACPFTLLAHYTELDWAESCGVSRYLIRVSVGLEDPEEIWEKLNSALSSAGP
jgi:cystathionine gamma-synthase